MVVGYYTLDLCCENIGICEVNLPGGIMTPDTYTGSTLEECLKDAKANGWIISDNQTKAWCSQKCKDKNSKKRKIKIRSER